MNICNIGQNLLIPSKRHEFLYAFLKWNLNVNNKQAETSLSCSLISSKIPKEFSGVRFLKVRIKKCPVLTLS